MRSPRRVSLSVLDLRSFLTLKSEGAVHTTTRNLLPRNLDMATSRFGAEAPQNLLESTSFGGLLHVEGSQSDESLLDVNLTAPLTS